MHTPLASGLLLGLTGIFLLGLRRVPEDTALTVHRFGRYVRTLQPGLRFILPMLEQISHRVRLIGHHVDVPANHLQARIFYQILDPERTGDALEHVDALVSEQTQRALSRMTKEASLTEILAGQLKKHLNDQLANLGVRVTRCDLRQ